MVDRPLPPPASPTPEEAQLGAFIDFLQRGWQSPMNVWRAPVEGALGAAGAGWQAMGPTPDAPTNPIRALLEGAGKTAMDAANFGVEHAVKPGVGGYYQNLARLLESGKMAPWVAEVLQPRLPLAGNLPVPGVGGTVELLGRDGAFRRQVAGAATKEDAYEAAYQGRPLSRLGTEIILDPSNLAGAQIGSRAVLGAAGLGSDAAKAAALAKGLSTGQQAAVKTAQALDVADAVVDTALNPALWAREALNAGGSALNTLWPKSLERNQQTQLLQGGRQATDAWLAGEGQAPVGQGSRDLTANIVGALAAAPDMPARVAAAGQMGDYELFRAVSDPSAPAPVVDAAGLVLARRGKGAMVAGESGLRFQPSPDFQAHASLDQTLVAQGAGPSELQAYHQLLDQFAEAASKRNPTAFPTPAAALAELRFAPTFNDRPGLALPAGMAAEQAPEPLSARYVYELPADLEAAREGYRAKRAAEKKKGSARLTPDEQLVEALDRLPPQATIDQLIDETKGINPALEDWYQRSAQWIFHHGFDHSTFFDGPEQVAAALAQPAAQTILARFDIDPAAAAQRLAGLSKQDVFLTLLGAGSIHADPKMNLYLALRGYGDLLAGRDPAASLGIPVRTDKLFAGLLHEAGLLEYPYLHALTGTAPPGKTVAPTIEPASAAAYPFGGDPAPGSLTGVADKLEQYVTNFRRELAAVEGYHAALARGEGETAARQELDRLRRSFVTLVNDRHNKRGYTRRDQWFDTDLLLDWQPQPQVDQRGRLTGPAYPAHTNAKGIPIQFDAADSADAPAAWQAIKGREGDDYARLTDQPNPLTGELPDKVSPDAAAWRERLPNLGAYQARTWALFAGESKVAQQLLEELGDPRVTAADGQPLLASLQQQARQAATAQGLDPATPAGRRVAQQALGEALAAELRQRWQAQLQSGELARSTLGKTRDLGEIATESAAEEAGHKVRLRRFAAGDPSQKVPPRRLRQPINAAYDAVAPALRGDGYLLPDGTTTIPYTTVEGVSSAERFRRGDYDYDALRAAPDAAEVRGTYRELPEGGHLITIRPGAGPETLGHELTHWLRRVGDAATQGEYLAAATSGSRRAFDHDAEERIADLGEHVIREVAPATNPTLARLLDQHANVLEPAAQPDARFREVVGAALTPGAPNPPPPPSTTPPPAPVAEAAAVVTRPFPALARRLAQRVVEGGGDAAALAEALQQAKFDLTPGEAARLWAETVAPLASAAPVLDDPPLAGLERLTPAVREIVEAPSTLYITAYRRGADEATNAADQQRLHDEVRQLTAGRGSVVAGQGVYDTPGAYEPSLAVTGLSREEALRLGAKYGQESVLLSDEGLVYTSGPHTGHVVPLAEPRPDISGTQTAYYTDFGDGQKVSYVLDDTAFPDDETLAATPAIAGGRHRRPATATLTPSLPDVVMPGPLAREAPRRLVERVAGEIAADPARIDATIRRVTPLFEANPSQAQATELYDAAGVRPHLEALLKAETPAEADAVFALMARDLGAFWRSVGALPPAMQRRLERLSRRPERRGLAVGRSAYDASVSDEQAALLVQMRADLEVQQFEAAYTAAQTAVTEAVARHGLAVDDFTTVRQLRQWQQTVLAGDAQAATAVADYLKLGGFSGQERLTLSQAEALGAGEAWVRKLAKDVGYDLNKPQPALVQVLRKLRRGWIDQALLTPRKHAQDALDMVVKNTIHGYSPLVSNDSAWAASRRWGLTVPPEISDPRHAVADLGAARDIFAPEREASPLGQVPVVGAVAGPTADKSRALSNWLESGARASVWLGEMRSLLHKTLPSFVAEVRRTTTPAAAKAVTTLGRDAGPAEVRAALLAQGVSQTQAQQLAGMWERTLHDASTQAQAKAREVHFDMGDIRNIEDWTKVRWWAPFYFWATRNIPYYLDNLAQNPNLTRALAHYREISEDERQRQGLPNRFRETLPLPLQLLGPLVVYANPLVAISLADQTKPMAEDTDATPAGEVVKALSPLGLRPAPWVDIPLTALGVYGPRDDPSSVLRHSGLVEAATGGAVNLEAPVQALVRRVQGAPAPTSGSTSYVDYQISRKLADMAVAARRPNDPEYVAAMADPTSPLYQQAREAVWRERLRDQALGMVSPVPTRFLGPEEAQVVAARRPFQVLLDPARTSAEERRRNWSYVRRAEPLTGAYDSVTSDPRVAEINAGFAALGPPADSPVTALARRRRLAEVTRRYPLLAAYLSWLESQPPGESRSPATFVTSLR